MPNSVKDLKHFSKASNYNSLNEIVAQLEPIEMELFMPKFRFECTSRAEKALGKVRKTKKFSILIIIICEF
jgi:serine protease inhibitor